MAFVQWAVIEHPKEIDGRAIGTCDKMVELLKKPVFDRSRSIMSNVYDVLYVRPNLQRKLPKPQERLARALVNSGRMRLDADTESNFTRLLLPKERINMTFTYRELGDSTLEKKSEARLMAALQTRHPAQKAAELCKQYLDKARADLKKRSPVSAKTELMTARALVFCNALPVMELIHREGAEIYVSFGQTVSDVMDIATWQEVGESNGLQSFGGGENAIYVSCGGHPFLDEHERTYTSDGFPALARCIVIAAQETGHNADMLRSPRGERIGRFSAVDWGRAPSVAAGTGRKADKKRCETLLRQSQRCGLNLIVEWERHLAFYRDNKLRNRRWLAAWLKSKLAWQLFYVVIRLQNMGGLCHLQKSPYPATLLRKCLRDMLFNLEPQADAYRRADPIAEEAMMCMEALARVPQQVVKWGHRCTRTSMPHLYRLYYGKVVPACAKAVARFKIPEQGEKKQSALPPRRNS